MDLHITCVVCGQVFRWPADRQRAFDFLGYPPPSICRTCRRKDRDDASSR
jgi:hypothetical protein